jgi:ribosome-binding factor A
MPEQRARKYHQDRVAGTLRDEITAMIEGQLSDPRIAFAYVSQVALNPGGKSALVYITVDGGEKEEEETLAALMAARGAASASAPSRKQPENDRSSLHQLRVHKVRAASLGFFIKDETVGPVLIPALRIPMRVSRRCSYTCL